MPSLLVFSFSFPRSTGSESLVSGKLVLALIRAGWEVDVISYRDNTCEKSCLWDNVQPCVREIKVNERLKLWIIRYLVWSFKAFLTGLKLSRKKKYDLILSRCQPIFSHVPAALLRMVNGTKWVANWNDPAPIRKYPPPYGEGLKARMGLFEKVFFDFLCSTADWHTFPGERLMHYMLTYMPPGVAAKSSVVPHIALKMRSSKNDVVNKRKMLFLHCGSVYFRNWREFLEGARLFVSKQGETDFQIGFLGWQPSELLKKVHDLELGNHVVVNEAVSYEDSFPLMSAADVLVIVEADSEEGIFLPSKLADYAEVGRPILAVSPKIGTLSDMLECYGGGIAVDCAAPEDIASGLEKMYKSWEKGTLDVDFNTARLNGVFSIETVVSLYQDLFEKLLRSETKN